MVTAAIVVSFCYFCTRKIKRFSPIDAIRNGETGERYARKGIIHLSKSFLAPVPFMAANDILSGIKQYISMILIFTLAMLKAIGFHNPSLVAWQSLRIGIVLLISIVTGTMVSTPLSKLTIEPVFRMMGAYSIQFEIIPVEVYVVYPLALLLATVLAAAVGALQLSKISASETSNIE